MYEGVRMIEEIVSVELPVHERLVIKKRRLMPEGLSENEINKLPRFSIVTGIHGDELDGQYIIFELIRRIKMHEDKLKGIIDIYPCVNPLGVDSGYRGIPMFDLDMNRVFPGMSNGAFAEYVAASLVNDIIGSDMCLDIHSSNKFVKEMLQVRLNDDNEERLLPYAKTLNADFVWVYSSQPVREATLSYSLNHLGVPTMVVEMGVGNRISKNYCKQLFEGVLNLLKEVGIWEGDTKEVKAPIVSKEGEVTFISALESGLFVPNIENLGKISIGSHIGDIIEPIEGRILQHLESPVDGIIFTIREHPVVYKGALLCRIYHKD